MLAGAVVAPEDADCCAGVPFVELLPLLPCWEQPASAKATKTAVTHCDERRKRFKFHLQKSTHNSPSLAFSLPPNTSYGNRAKNVRRGGLEISAVGPRVESVLVFALQNSPPELPQGALPSPRLRKYCSPISPWRCQRKSPPRPCSAGGST